MRAMMLIGVTTLAAMMVPAHAQDRAVYVGGDLALVASSGMDLTFTPGGAVGTVGHLETRHKRGLSGSVLAGYDFGLVRLEAEASHLGADVDKATSDWSHAGGLVVGSQPMDGDVRARSMLLNMIVDFDRDGGYAFFVGGGVGRSKVKVSGMALQQGGSVLLDDEDGDSRSSWQAIAGVRKSMSDHLELHLRYRYLDIDDVEMTGLAGRAVSGQMTSHSVSVGVAYRF